MIHGFSPHYQLTQWAPYVVFENLFNWNDCAKLIGYMPDSKLEATKIDTSGISNETIRSSKACVLESTKDTAWVFERIEGAAVRCNDGVYAMDLMGFYEPINLMQYVEGDHYDWHMDGGNKIFSQRKLSVVVQLTDENDYEGGDLEFFQNGVAPRKKGSGIFFPSYMYHRVTPIIKGVRRSLVCWLNGMPYR